jgi:hypothetical protein
MAVVKLRRQGLILVLTLCVVSQSMGAEISKRCQEGTSLWIPQAEDASMRIAKWDSAIGYEIDAKQPDARMTALVENSLRFQSQESGLKISPGSGFGADLYIAIIPDITTLASPVVRKGVANYIQDYYRKQGTQGSFQINAALWDASARNIVPKCFGVTLIPLQVRLRAFLAVQQDASAVCINIGLAEILGLGNLRKYYLGHGQNDPSDLIAIGLQTLYDKRIVAGMSRSDASNKLEEVCAGR